jgi:hypothetical protein
VTTFCNRLLQQTLADVQVVHCKAPQQHAPRCFPAHALFAVCRRRRPRTLRCARQTRGERSPAAAASTSALKRLAPDPPPPPPPPLLQLYKGFIYTSAHVHDVDGQTVIRDGDTPVDIDAGFEVAPGDASDIEVANAHAWGSGALIFSDGAWAYSLNTGHGSKGIASSFAIEIVFYNLMMISGIKLLSGNLKVDSQGRMSSAIYSKYDVLLRKRA